MKHINPLRILSEYLKLGAPMSFEQIISELNAGGTIVWVLLVISGLMWGAISARTYFLYGMCKPLELRGLVRKNHVVEVLFGKSVICTDFLRSNKRKSLLQLEKELTRYRTLIFSLVTCAPLLGLLGTVTGMIDTFDAIADMNLFSSDGGIAGGISKALLTTQLGLVVAVPGILFERVLTARSQKILISVESYGSRVSKRMDSI